MSFKEEMQEPTRWFKNWIVWCVGLTLVVGFILWFANRGEQAADNAIRHYEEFQTLYNTAEKLNADLCNKRAMPQDDRSFEQFTQAQQINTLKTKLNGIVADYNAKSNMWNRSMWKSSTLPYELTVAQFDCYADPAPPTVSN